MKRKALFHWHIDFTIWRIILILFFAIAGYGIGETIAGRIGSVIGTLACIVFIYLVFFYYDKLKNKEAIEKWRFYVRFTLVFSLLSLIQTILFFASDIFPERLTWSYSVILNMLFWVLLIMTIFIIRIIKKSKLSSFFYSIPVLISINVAVILIFSVSSYFEFMCIENCQATYLAILSYVSIVIDSLLVLLTVYFIRKNGK